MNPLANSSVPLTVRFIAGDNRTIVKMAAITAENQDCPEWARLLTFHHN
jgi:hypothetical protein